MAEVSIPGYFTVNEVADRLHISPSRVRQLLMELRRGKQDLGYLVGTIRLFSASEVEIIEKLHADKRQYEKSD